MRLCKPPLGTAKSIITPLDERQFTKTALDVV